MSSQRVAVVTGSNKGIGFAIVRALCKQFDGIVYLTARDATRGAEAVKKLEGEGLKPKFHSLDVDDIQSINCLKEFMEKEHGGVDVLVHNAGMAYKDASTTPFGEQAIHTVRVNFTGTVNLCNAFLPIIKSNGRLVNMSSFVTGFSMKKCSQEVRDFFKSPDLTEEKLIAKLDQFVEAAKAGNHVEKGFANTAYGMSKIGVTAFTEILGKRARQLKNKNVLVNCSCPGWVRTDMAGDKAPLTPDQGAETPVWLALLPAGDTEPNGKLYQKKKLLPW